MAKARWKPSYARLQPCAGYGGHPSRDAHLTRPAIRSRERSERLAKDGGEGGIRTRQDPLEPVCYRFYNADVTVNASVAWRLAPDCTRNFDPTDPGDAWRLSFGSCERGRRWRRVGSSVWRRSVAACSIRS